MKQLDFRMDDVIKVQLENEHRYPFINPCYCFRGTPIEHRSIIETNQIMCITLWSDHIAKKVVEWIYICIDAKLTDCPNSNDLK